MFRHHQFIKSHPPHGERRSEKLLIGKLRILLNAIYIYIGIFYFLYNIHVIYIYIYIYIFWVYDMYIICVLYSYVMHAISILFVYYMDITCMLCVVYGSVCQKMCIQLIDGLQWSFMMNRFHLQNINDSYRFYDRKRIVASSRQGSFRNSYAVFVAGVG